MLKDITHKGEKSKDQESTSLSIKKHKIRRVAIDGSMGQGNWICLDKPEGMANGDIFGSELDLEQNALLPVVVRWAEELLILALVSSYHILPLRDASLNSHVRKT